ncbi:glycoside hydrolase [Lactarius quietus]|nr:glycoside hydrolase [Lactarius quietus]
MTDRGRTGGGSYLTYAAPHDELRPLTRGPVDNFNGWGVSIIDSLDTMWLMGLYDEFDDALAFVANATFPTAPKNYVPFFETVIRYLGGLLSAYALSKEPVLLFRADHLGNALLPVFYTPSGLPIFSVNTVNGGVAKGWGPEAVLAEILTCQLEYKYLSYLTGRQEYYNVAEKIMDVVYKTNLTSTRELLPALWSSEKGTPLGGTLSVGGQADSAYEYMLKQWILTGRTDIKARDLYLRSIDAILDHLTYVTPNRNLLYVTDATAEFQGQIVPSHKLQHLTCFLPGLLALGAATLPDVPKRHMWAARGFAHTCWILYADSPSGLAPDEVLMRSMTEHAGLSPLGRLWTTHLQIWEQNGAEGDPPGVRPAPPMRGTNMSLEYTPVVRPGHYLRPETLESFYLLWRTTGDEVWRERGWEVFEALERETRLEGGGYACLKNAHHVHGEKYDEMPSWFLAETLKYLFLLFTDEDLIPLDKWVLNTEAHPFPIFHWSEWEMERLGITRDIPAEKDDLAP